MRIDTSTEVVILYLSKENDMSVKLNDARKGILAIALGLACALPAAAQNAAESNTATTTTPSTTTVRNDAASRGDDHGNWGWLGLLGLAGLFGLRRNRDPYNDCTRTEPAR